VFEWPHSDAIVFSGKFQAYLGQIRQASGTLEVGPSLHLIGLLSQDNNWLEVDLLLC
jgi:hypothetical protein